MHRLIAACPPLDANSLYCNLLQCAHFAETSAVAKDDTGEIVGFLAGYIPPKRRTTLFVWQVAVAPRARGHGLGLRLLKAVIGRMHSWSLQYVQATITEDNRPSWGLFLSLAKALNAPHATTPMFEADRHFAGAHDTEHLLTIGPIHPTQITAASRRETYA